MNGWFFGFVVHSCVLVHDDSGTIPFCYLANPKLFLTIAKPGSSKITFPFDLALFCMYLF